MRASLSYDSLVVARAGVGVERQSLSGLLLVYPLFVLAVSIVTIVAPQKSGWLAVMQIFGPHLFLPLLLLLPFAFLRGAVGLRIVLLICLGVFALRFMPALGAARAADVGAPQISVLSWNVYAGNPHYDRISRLLARKPADVVLLQEAQWQWVEYSQEVQAAYPYRLASPSDVPPGMVFLSVYPIVTHGILDGERDLWDIPRLLWVKLDLGNGQRITVVGAHPMSAYSVGKGCSLPVCYSPDWRDEQISAMRDSYISPMLASGEPLIVAGDFNITEREPAYADLSRGLIDAWRTVGSGLGSTWRPSLLMVQDVGLLRIDYLFSSHNIAPLEMSVDCSSKDSDHCMVVGRFEIGR